MARKSTKKTTAQIGDELLEPVADVAVLETEPEITEVPDGEEGAEEDITYTMGDIKVLEGDEEEEKLDLKKITTEEEQEEEWVDPEYIQDDRDPYLDDANYDMDNPYNDDEY